MLDWLKNRSRTARTARHPEAVATEGRPFESPRLMADGEPSRYVPKDDPERFAGQLPPLHLVPYGANNLTLCEDATGLLVGPTDRRLASAGIYVAKLRGEKYHKGACRRGDFAPGVEVRLVAEPTNPHDPNAVAVTEDVEGAKIAAYVSKGYAKRFGKLIASGEPLRVVSIRGTGPNRECDSITILAGHPDLVAHLLSRRPSGLPAPHTR